MTDNGMRRPPRIWEQKLEDMIRNSGMGSSSPSTSSIVSSPTPGPGGPGESFEPPPVIDPDPSTPRLPPAPSLFGAIGGISILWTGLDADGVLLPTGTTVQVHVSTTTGFTPDAGTLRGVVGPGEILAVTALVSGTTYFVRFVLVFPDGTVGEVSAQASLSAGFVLEGNVGVGEITADLVNFDATAIGGIQQFVGTATPPTTGATGSTWINTSEGSYYTLTGGAWVKRQWDSAAIAPSAINTLQIATGAITAESAIIADAAIGNAKIISLTATKLTAGIIDADVIEVRNLDADNITTGSLSADRISGGTLTGVVVQTSAGSFRVALADDELQFYSGGIKRLAVATAFNSDLGQYVAEFTSGIDIGAGMYVNGAAVDMPGVYNNNTTGLDEVGITTGNRLRRISSSQLIKYDMATLAGVMSESVDDDRQLGEATAVAHDVLDLAVTEFSVIDRVFPDPLPEGDEGELPSPEPVATERRVLGFIAEDVAAKFPIAATSDKDDNPAGVLDTAILAALLAVVKEQQATIQDLTARIEALEVN